MDYKVLEGIDAPSRDEETIYTAHPLGLFYVKRSGDLVPIAVQLFGANCPQFTLSSKSSSLIFAP